MELMLHAKQAIKEVMDSLLHDRYRPAEKMLARIFKIEQGFINTMHPDFVKERENFLQGNIDRMKKIKKEAETNRKK